MMISLACSVRRLQTKQRRRQSFAFTAPQRRLDGPRASHANVPHPLLHPPDVGLGNHPRSDGVPEVGEAHPAAAGLASGSRYRLLRASPVEPGAASPAKTKSSSPTCVSSRRSWSCSGCASRRSTTSDDAGFCWRSRSRSGGTGASGAPPAGQPGGLDSSSVRRCVVQAAQVADACACYAADTNWSNRVCSRIGSG